MSNITVKYTEGDKLVYLMNDAGAPIHIAHAREQDKDKEIEYLREKIETYQGALTALEDFYKKQHEPSEDILDLAWEMYSTYHGSMGNAMIFVPEIFKEAHRNGNPNTEAWVVAAKAVWTKVNVGR